jgi:hypothetical protein
MAKKKINRTVSKSALRKQKRIQDCARALHLRLAGNDYRSISITENVGVGEAYRRVQDALAMTSQQMEKDATQLRSIEAERIELLWKALWPAAQAGDLDAIDRVMRLHALRTRLLGLDVNQVTLQVDDQAVAVLADIIARRVTDARILALIKADFASFVTTQGQRALPAPEDDFIEGEVLNGLESDYQKTSL